MPAAFFTFNDGIKDKSVNKIRASVKNVKVTNLGRAAFNGSSEINLRSFAGMDWGNSLVIGFKFRFENFTNKTTNNQIYQALVTNGQCQGEQGSSIMIVANQNEARFTLKTTAVETAQTVRVPYVSNLKNNIAFLLSVY